MQSKVLSLTVSLSLILTLLSSFPFTVSAANINIGEYVQMGTYYGKPILWRCVSFEKISGYDANGNPIIDSTDTRTTYADGYLPLMLSDKILCLKAFDAAGNNTSASHGRGGNNERKKHGSDYWADSNIRDWLMSDTPAGNVVWSCGNPPNSDHLYKGYNEYDKETGFLSNFTQSERNAMKTIIQKSLLYRNEYTDMSLYGACPFDYDASILYADRGYSAAYSEWEMDSMFLLDVRQIKTIYENDELLGGNNYYIGIPSEDAVLNSEYKSDDLNAISKWHFWLRTPNAYSFNYYYYFYRA